jgi:outer membrane protein TolC
VIELGYRVRGAFYALQAAEQRLAIAQRMLDGSAAARDAARAMFEAGNIPELDLASEEASYEKARIDVARLELEAATERERVHRLLGAWGEDADFQVADELRPAPESASIPEDLEARALEASLDLLETRHRIEGLARRAGATRAAGWIPDVALDVHALHGDPEDSTAESEWRFGGGLSVGVPLFDRGQGTANALDAELDALVERYHGMAVDLRSAAREAKYRVVSSHARARQYQEVIVPAQRRVTEQTLLMYNAMHVGIFQLLTARREQLDVELAYVETLREHWSAVAELQAILAGRRVSSEARGPATTMGGMAASDGGH